MTINDKLLFMNHVMNFIYFYHNTLMVMDCCLFMINTFLWKKLKFVVMNFEDKCERKKKRKNKRKNKLNYFCHQVKTLTIRDLKYLPYRAMRASWKINYFCHQVNTLIIWELKCLPYRLILSHEIRDFYIMTINDKFFCMNHVMKTLFFTTH